MASRMTINLLLHCTCQNKFAALTLASYSEKVSLLMKLNSHCSTDMPFL